MKNVLFLCTGNSCRSIMAEALLNHFGAGKFQAYSAGSTPTGEVHPLSIAMLKSRGIEFAGYRSKSWNEFADKQMDIVVTVCDNAAGEICPVFYGAPLKAHWGAPDPAHYEGTEAEIVAEFERVFKILETRVKALVALPELSKQELTAQLNEIGSYE